MELFTFFNLSANIPRMFIERPSEIGEIIPSNSSCNTKSSDLGRGTDDGIIEMEIEELLFEKFTPQEEKNKQSQG